MPVKRHEGKTVLIIEDETDIRNLASRVLELEGWRTLQTDDGEEGLRLASENQVSLVLLDLRLSRGDGWWVLAQIKGKPELSAIPVIIFTASAAVSQRDKALGMGAADYLVKPISVSSLKQAVARILY